MNVVTGSGAKVGDYLVNHKKIAGIAFTGSKEVGFNCCALTHGAGPSPSSPRWEV